MAAPINRFEIVESIRFFGEIVATPGISEVAKATCNVYIEKLVEVLQESVQEITAKASGLTIVK